MSVKESVVKNSRTDKHHPVDIDVIIDPRGADVASTRLRLVGKVGPFKGDIFVDERTLQYLQVARDPVVFDGAQMLPFDSMIGLPANVFVTHGRRIRRRGRSHRSRSPSVADMIGKSTPAAAQNQLSLWPQPHDSFVDETLFGTRWQSTGADILDESKV